MSDFVSLAGLLLFGEVILSAIVSHWRLIIRVIPRLSAVIFPFGMALVICLIANLVFSATDNVGAFNQLKPLSSNGLIALDEGSKTFLFNIRVYTVFFEHYPGWTLVTPAELLSQLRLNASGKLQRWGRIGSIVTADYPAALSDQEMRTLLALKNVTVENGAGLHYIAILEDDASRKICFRTYDKDVFVVPVSLSPICGNK
jgi:hypothetical protein